MPEGVPTPFGTFWTPEQVRAFRLDLDTYFAYSDAVQRKLQAFASTLGDAQALEPIDLLPLLPPLSALPTIPWQMNRLEMFSFFAIGHVAEHLGEAQCLRGTMGVPGAVF